MPVQIPQVKRLNVDQPQSAGRIEGVSALHNEKDYTHVASAFKGLAHQGISVADNIEDQAIDTEVTKRVTQFESDWKARMYGQGESIGVKYQDGNPAELYKKFDDDTIAKYNELSNVDGLSPRAKDIVGKRLREKADSLEMQKLTQYGYQNAQYEDKVTTAAIDLEKSNLVNNAGFIKAGDPDSFAAFDKTVGDIRNLRLKNGMKFGTVTASEDGDQLFIGDDGKPMKIKVGEATRYQLSKELSDGIYSAMDNLIKSGQIDAAKEMKDRYAGYLDPVHHKGIAGEIATATLKSDAYAAVDKAENMSPDAREKLYKTLKPDVREKAEQIDDERSRRKINRMDRASKENYERLGTYVMQRMNSDNPFAGPNEMEADPKVAHALSKLTNPKDREALYNMVEAGPKSSKPEAVARVQDLFFGNDPQGRSPKDLSPMEFQKEIVGLNKKDKDFYTKKYVSFSSETGAQEFTRYKAASKNLEDQLVAIGYLVPDEFNRISGQEKTKLVNARNDLTDFLDKSGPLNAKEQNDFVRKYAVSLATNKAFSPPARNQKSAQPQAAAAPLEFKPHTLVGIYPAGQQPQANPVGAQQAGSYTAQVVKGKSRIEWQRQFRVQFGHWPNGAQELEDFIKKQD